MRARAVALVALLLVCGAAASLEVQQVEELEGVPGVSGESYVIVERSDAGDGAGRVVGMVQHLHTSLGSPGEDTAPLLALFGRRFGPQEPLPGSQGGGLYERVSTLAALHCAARAAALRDALADLAALNQRMQLRLTPIFLDGASDSDSAGGQSDPAGRLFGAPEDQPEGGGHKRLPGAMQVLPGAVWGGQAAALGAQPDPHQAKMARRCKCKKHRKAKACKHFLKEQEKLARELGVPVDVLLGSDMPHHKHDKHHSHHEHHEHWDGDMPHHHHHPERMPWGGEMPHPAGGRGDPGPKHPPGGMLGALRDFWRGRPEGEPEARQMWERQAEPEVGDANAMPAEWESSSSYAVTPVMGYVVVEELPVWVSLEDTAMPAIPEADPLNWSLWEDDGSLNWGMIIFVTLMAACAAIQINLMFYGATWFGGGDEEPEPRRQFVVGATAGGKGGDLLAPLLPEGPADVDVLKAKLKSAAAATATPESEPQASEAQAVAGAKALLPKADNA